MKGGTKEANKQIKKHTNQKPNRIELNHFENIRSYTTNKLNKTINMGKKTPDTQKTHRE